MSSFNESNEMASELVFGRTYQGNEPTPKPERLVFVKGDSTAVVTAQEESQREWADVANTIHDLLNHSYLLGCDMNVSWNGRYDTDGEPMPDSNYLPCRKPVAINLDVRNLCNEHSLAEYADRVRLVVDEAKSQQRLSNVEEL
jgi:hypothetical protein